MRPPPPVSNVADRPRCSIICCCWAATSRLSELLPRVGAGGGTAGSAGLAVLNMPMGSVIAFMGLDVPRGLYMAFIESPLNIPLTPTPK